MAAKKGKKSLSKVTSVLVILVAAGLAWYGTSKLMPIILPVATLEKSLAVASQELNKQTPMVVDGATTLLSTVVVEKSFNYNYQYSGTPALTAANLAEAVKPNVINGVCTTPDMRELIDKGATYVYNYYDTTRTYIGNISVQKSDCK